MNEALRTQRLDEIRKKEPYSAMEVVYNSVRRKLPVHEIPLDVLIYNKYNGRIASMVKSWERQHRDLDASQTEDKTIIERFLWDSNPGRNKHTQQDLEDRKQLRYGIVTRDGVIIDGNRRALLLSKIAVQRKETPGIFLAVILEDTLDGNPKEIMRLETAYQMGEDEKLGYNAIEKYLRVKDLEEQTFDLGEIAKMMSEDEDIIKKWKRTMQLMDSYLKLLNYDGIYTRLDDTEGLFVDLDQYLERYKKETALATWAYKPADVSDLQAVFFDLIRARFSGDGKLYRMAGRPSKKESFFCTEDVWKEFRDFHFANVDPITGDEKTVDQYRTENPDGNLDELLKQRDKDWESKVRPKLQENFGRSQRRLDDFNAKSAPLELLTRALKTLETIDTTASAFWNDQNVEEAVAQINSLTYEFKKIIKRKGQ
ncbi:MAG TPA: hypothetical protein VKH81_11635 [Candidatus Angelobacter sp.]|nr:hypothetical protein [Candidatus Angelobacter sp.]